MESGKTALHTSLSSGHPRQDTRETDAPLHTSSLLFTCRSDDPNTSGCFGLQSDGNLSWVIGLMFVAAVMLVPGTHDEQARRRFDFYFLWEISKMESLLIGDDVNAIANVHHNAIFSCRSNHSDPDSCG